MLHTVKTLLLDTPVKNAVHQSIRAIYTTSRLNLFWERDPKGGYNPEGKNKLRFDQHVREGFKEIKNEISKWRNEMSEKFDAELLFANPGEVEKKWVLHSKEDLEHWTETCDADHGEGFSSCKLSIGPLGTGVFSGILNTRVPKDGKINRSGYCTIRTKRARKSFKRDSYHDWTPYTHVVIKCRGDGRSYMLNIATSGYFDQMWNDMYSYILYTRGGPYWQVSKIPFSKFFFSSKGRIQDSQCKIQLDYVTNFGVTAADKINGPFKLEIDYIGLEFDPNHEDDFAYEQYKLPANIANN